jgi:hypothetical protein
MQSLRRTKATLHEHYRGTTPEVSREAWSTKRLDTGITQANMVVITLRLCPFQSVIHVKSGVVLGDANILHC